LDDQTDLALALFDAAFVPHAKISWQIERNKVIEVLKSEMTDRQTFERCINARIIEARTMLKLPPNQLNYIP
jgi:hypothetical protein